GRGAGGDGLDDGQEGPDEGKGAEVLGRGRGEDPQTHPGEIRSRGKRLLQHGPALGRRDHRSARHPHGAGAGNFGGFECADSQDGLRRLSHVIMSTILFQVEGSIARIKLNRPEVKNAFNDALVAELADALKAVEKSPVVRVVILSGEGDFFCAGADLNWMKSFVGASKKKNEEDARRLAKLLQHLNELKKPTIAQVHGAAIGGGVGLLAAGDV